MKVVASAPQPLADVTREWVQERYRDLVIGLFEVNRALRTGELIATQYLEGRDPIVHPKSYWSDNAKVDRDPSQDVIILASWGGDVGPSWITSFAVWIGNERLPGKWFIHQPAEAMPVSEAVLVHDISKNLSENIRKSGGAKPKYPWGRIKTEIALRILSTRDADGMPVWPENQADVARKILVWCRTEGIAEPPWSTLQQVVSDLVKALQKALK